MTLNRKTNLTDFRYKDEHRTLDERFKMTDIDVLLYDKDQEPIAMMETKHYWKNELNFTEKTQLNALTKFAKRANLPLFYVFYYYPGEDDYSKSVNRYGKVWRYKIFPINDLAKETLREPTEMTKRQYAEFEYKLRKILPSPYYLSTYDNTETYVPFIDSL